ncbi:hypothetical protein [Paracoccus sp. SCSIO 75233]|uniref:hypothetical protein n=1 Tax=Paracoccus sp. SCSIO 75233 TaxID=3017782 RepID=UPI0022F10098|nr:hypothetical protein [Paracoccus sp. SCSIO 75233]WBU53299.1 hypothetical protein PAF12_00195 [Paracoccus sp. SCSIO 75233]
MAEKDIWDKFDIIGRITGAILIPVAVAYSAFTWNAQRTQSQVMATMAQTATLILSTETSPNASVEEMNALNILKSWAITVLQYPERPHSLSDEAAAELKSMTLGRYVRPIFEVEPVVEVEPLILDLPVIVEQYASQPVQQ